jgi:hypothetical protein
LIFLLLLAAKGGFLRFRCSCIFNTFRCGSQKPPFSLRRSENSIEPIFITLIIDK